VQDDMVVLLRRRVVLVELRKDAARHQHPPRHAQMDQKAFARRQVGQNVFRPTPQRDHPLSGQPGCHADGQRPAQVRPVHIRAQDHAAFHHRQQPAADGFNLGQFGHRVLQLSRIAICAVSIRRA
jgi:hypothetical protein